MERTSPPKIPPRKVAFLGNTNNDKKLCRSLPAVSLSSLNHQEGSYKRTPPTSHSRPLPSHSYKEISSSKPLHDPSAPPPLPPHVISTPLPTSHVIKKKPVPLPRSVSSKSASSTSTPRKSLSTQQLTQNIPPPLSPRGAVSEGSTSFNTPPPPIPQHRRTTQSPGSQTNATDLFRQAIRQNNLSLISSLLTYLDPNLTFDKAGTTPLHVASSNPPSSSCISLLLSLGGDIHRGDAEGNTPLHLAAKDGLMDIIELLIRNGASILSENREGVLPLHFFAHSSPSREYEDKQTQQTIDLLFPPSTPADSLLTDHRESPLHYACQGGANEVIIKSIIQKGGSIHLNSGKGVTPLSLAKQRTPPEEGRRVAAFLFGEYAQQSIAEEGGEGRGSLDQWEEGSEGGGREGGMRAKERRMARMMKNQTQTAWADLIRAGERQGLLRMREEGEEGEEGGVRPNCPPRPASFVRTSIVKNTQPSSPPPLPPLIPLSREEGLQESSSFDEIRGLGGGSRTSCFLKMIPRNPSLIDRGGERKVGGKELVIEDGEVKGGTVEGLIYGLLDPKIPNSSFYHEVFFLTYRSFVSDSKLLKILIKKYHDLLPIIIPVDSSLSFTKTMETIQGCMNDLVSSPKSTPEQVESAIAQIDSWVGIVTKMVDSNKTKDCCEKCDCFCSSCTSFPKTCASCIFSCNCSFAPPPRSSGPPSSAPSLFDFFEAERLLGEMKNEKKSLLSALSVFCDTLGVGIRNTNRSKRMLICNILKKWYELRQKEVGKRGEGEGGLREVFKGFVETVKERDGMVVGRTLGALLGGATGIFSSFSSVEPLAVSPSPSVPLTSSVSVGNFGSQKKKMRTKTDVKWAEDEMKEGGRSVTMVEMKGLRSSVSSQQPTILDFDVIEVARQVTLMDHSFFTDIPVFDLMNKKLIELGGEGDGGDVGEGGEVAGSESLTSLPAVAKWIKWFNDLNMLTATWILKESSARKRVQTIEYIITLLVRLRALQNFQSVIAILGALRGSSVFRLKKTWAAISKTKRKQFDEIVAEMSHSNNSAKYRALLEVCDPPLIPFLGTHLSDLTFIEDGNPDNLSSGYVNFTKRRLMGRVISELRSFQCCFYSFQPVSEIRGFLESAKPLSDTAQYEHSLAIEPRVKAQ